MKIDVESIEDIFPETPQNRRILSVITQKFCRNADENIIRRTRDTFGGMPNVSLVCDAISAGLAKMSKNAAESVEATSHRSGSSSN